MAAEEIVDISGTTHARRRQLARRIGVPVLGVALVILSILGISLYTFETNRAGALALSSALLQGLRSRITREVSLYLSPATQATLIARDMVARGAIPDGRTTIEGFAASMLNQVPHLEGFYVANGEGDFIMVRRDPAGGTDTKLILNVPGARQVSSTHLDAAGKPLDHALSPGDDFDPRRRSWYQGALKTDGVYWSSPYIFYTTHAPGITAAIRLLHSNTVAGSMDRVFGVDITLEALSSFLASLHIGQTGRAAIVDGAGHVIAAPELAHPGSSGDLHAAQATATTLHDPALVGAYDHYHVGGYGDRTILVDKKRYVTIASRLPAAGQDWVLLIAVPEVDFTAFADHSSRRNLLLSLITIALAMLLGLLLVRQNRRLDRSTRLLSRSREIGARESRALSMLSEQPGLFDPAQPAPGLTESLAEMSEGAARQHLAPRRRRPHPAVRGQLRPAPGRPCRRAAVVAFRTAASVRCAGQGRADRGRRCRIGPAHRGAAPAADAVVRQPGDFGAADARTGRPGRRGADRGRDGAGTGAQLRPGGDQHRRHAAGRPSRTNAGRGRARDGRTRDRRGAACRGAAAGGRGRTSRSARSWRRETSIRPASRPASSRRSRR